MKLWRDFVEWHRLLRKTDMNRWRAVRFSAAMTVQCALREMNRNWNPWRWQRERRALLDELFWLARRVRQLEEEKQNG